MSSFGPGVCGRSFTRQGFLFLSLHTERVEQSVGYISSAAACLSTTGNPQLISPRNLEGGPMKRRTRIQPPGRKCIHRETPRQEDRQSSPSESWRIMPTHYTSSIHPLIHPCLHPAISIDEPKMAGIWGWGWPDLGGRTESTTLTTSVASTTGITPSPPSRR